MIKLKLTRRAFSIIEFFKFTSSTFAIIFLLNRSKRKKMVQSMMDKSNTARHYEHASRNLRKPKTVIIVYDPPKVVVVRHFTKTIISSVDPDEYRKKFDRVLLDTSTLLAWARRLNIQENLVKMRKKFVFS